MTDNEGLGDLLRRVGNWGIFASRTSRVDEVAIYKHSDADGNIQIGKKYRAKNIWYGVILRDGKGKMIHAEETTDFGDIIHILNDYNEDRCNLTHYECSSIVKTRVRNPTPGHPIDIPTAEQLGWAE